MLNVADDLRPVFTLDGADRIVSANDAWFAFARLAENGADPQTLLDGPVWAWFGDGQVRQLWELLYRRVRGSGARMFVPMRSDTPQHRRLVDIELRPLGERAILHIWEPVWIERRPRVRLLDPTCPRNDAVMRSCGWCRRVQVRLGVWQEIEDAQFALGIEDGPTLPRLDWSVCAACKQSLLKTFPANAA